MKKKRIIKYIYSEEIKTDIKNPTEEELVNIFNEKFLKTIMKIEKDCFWRCDI